MDVSHCNRALKNFCVAGLATLRLMAQQRQAAESPPIHLGIPGHQTNRPSDQSFRLFSCKVRAQMMACLMALMAV